MTKRILLVEDDALLRATLKSQLVEEGFEVEAVDGAESALGRIGSKGPPDILLLDVRLGGMSGVDLVRELSDRGEIPATILISGEATISETVEGLRLGVRDFIEKPFSKARLITTIRNTAESAELTERITSLQSGAVRLLGDSPVIRTLREQIARVAPTEARVLITGESGTGKELVAAALHAGSRRRARPFVRINCAAIPPTLIEDALFGHARGAFTDAATSRGGLFEEADGGTLFLDEIGDMDLALQARLLRVLEDGVVRRLGDSRDRRVDVRILCATNRDLASLVEERGFREDLYFRIGAVPVVVPPLRERGRDIDMLFTHYLRACCAANGRPVPRVDDRLLDVIRGYRWPGNVRELRNLAERLSVFGSDPLTPTQLPVSIQRTDEPPIGALTLAATTELVTLRELRTRCERDYIEGVLQRTRWNVTEAAKILDIQRPYLHQKITSLGLRRPDEGDE